MLRLVVESWTWYAFAMFVALARLVSRSLLFGSPLRVKIDDWLIVFAICTYTTLLVCMNIVADSNSNLIPPGVDVHSFTQQEINDRVFGSKLVVVVEQMQCLTIWTLKATLLIMYYRLTKQLPQNLWVKILAAYVAITFVVMEVLYLGVWCRPFHDYWAVPTPNKQCDTATDHLITNAVFNLSSDVAMLAIGFSLAARSKLPLMRRLLLHAIFALGIFVIVAAVLNKYYSFTQPYGSLWTFWYIRESSTAMIVANLPYTWTLIRRVFHVGSFSGDSDTTERKRQSATTTPRTSNAGLRGALASQLASTLHHNPFRHSRHEAASDKRSSESHSGNDLAASSQLGGDGAYSPGVEVAPKSPDPVATKLHTWREKGVFGRGDAELFADEHDSDEIFADIEAQRRRFSSVAPMVDQRRDGTAPEDMVLNDVGTLGGAPPPAALSRQPSDKSGRRSSETDIEIAKSERPYI